MIGFVKKAEAIKSYWYDSYGFGKLINLLSVFYRAKNLYL